MIKASSVRFFPAKFLIGFILCFAIVIAISNWTVLFSWEEGQVDTNEIKSNHTYSLLHTSEETELFRKIYAETAEILNYNRNLVLDIWLNRGKLDYNDDLLVEYVRDTHLTLPDKSIPYNLTHNNVTNPSEGQVQAVWNLFENKTGDFFFVDCGANNGEFISNTLWLEKEKGWNGLLIEADPTTFAELQSKHRKAWHANLCLSTDKIPKIVSFFRNLRDSGVNGLNKRPGFGVTAEIKVQCIPLYTMLLALNRTVVDFFSLDIEGLELEVLKTIPFDKILIKTFAIEHWSIPGGAAILEIFMKQNGYYLHKRISTNLSQDSIFIHNSLRPVAAVEPNGQAKGTTGQP